MKIITQLTKADFIHAYFTMLFTRTFRLVIALTAVVMIAAAVLSGWGLSASITNLLVVALLFGAFFVSQYLMAMHIYNSTPRLKETIQYIPEDEKLIIQGASFYSEVTYNLLYKVERKKKYLLIWHSRRVANIILTKDVLPEQLNRFRTLLIAGGVKTVGI